MFGTEEQFVLSGMYVMKQAWKEASSSGVWHYCYWVGRMMVHHRPGVDSCHVSIRISEYSE